jgi:Flp pilus assembly protein TadG
MRSMRERHQRDPQAGSVAVEFALVLTFVLVFIISVAIEGGVNIARRHAMVTAARAGALAGSLSTVTDAQHVSNATTAATSRLTELGFARSGEYTVSSAISTDGSQSGAPSQIAVTVTMTYKPLMPVLHTSSRTMTTTVTLPVVNN